MHYFAAYWVYLGTIVVVSGLWDKWYAWVFVAIFPYLALLMLGWFVERLYAYGNKKEAGIPRSGNGPTKRDPV